MTVRDARPGDGAALAALHQEMAAYYAELAPEHFRRPAVDGMAIEIDRELRDTRADVLALVAEVEGEVAGALWAVLVDAPGEREIDSTSRRVRIDYVVTAAAWRRQGIARALVEAAEAWGRANGALTAEATTYRPSPLSFPFWTARMGYAERSVNLRKRLA